MAGELRLGALVPVLVALNLLCLASAAHAQSGDPAASTALVEQRVEQSFQRGLTAASAEDYPAAATHFDLAARFPVTDDPFNPSLHWSERPEIWFNLALARSRLPGYELRSLAGFQVYLQLRPDAENAAEVRRQFPALDAAFRTRLRLVIESLERVAPQPSSAMCQVYRDHPCQQIAGNLVAARLFIGDRAEAIRTMDRNEGSRWREDVFALGRYNDLNGFESDGTAFAMLPAIGQQALARERMHYLLESGDLTGALAAQRSVTGVPSDLWIIACAANAAENSALVQEIITSATLNLRSNEDRLHAISALLDIGETERASLILSQIDIEIAEVSDLRRAVGSGESTRYCARMSGWNGASRLGFLQRIAAAGVGVELGSFGNDRSITNQIAGRPIGGEASDEGALSGVFSYYSAQLTSPDIDTRLRTLTHVTESVGRIALTYRQVHGPF